MIASRLVLEDAIRDYLKKKGVTHFHFLSSQLLKQKFTFNQKVDVVLLGDGAYFFSHGRVSQLACQMHFWVLCHRMKQILVEGFNLPEDAVSVIERYQLFPAKVAEYSIAESQSFVYAGRDVEGKNVQQLFGLVNLLQKKWFPRHSLYLFGKDFENMHSSVTDYSWTEPPVFMGDQGSAWVQSKIPKPVFISLSDYRYEDFSVSTAEAQMSGMPIVVPSWFGFNDAWGTEVLKLPPLCTFSSLEVAHNFWLKKFDEHLKKDSVLTLTNDQNLPSEGHRRYLKSEDMAESILKSDKGFHHEINDFFGLTQCAVGMEAYPRLGRILSEPAYGLAVNRTSLDTNILFDSIIQLTHSYSFWVSDKISGVVIRRVDSSHDELLVAGWQADVLKNITSIHFGRTLNESLRASHPEVLKDLVRLEELEDTIEQLISLGILEIAPMSAKCLKVGIHE